MPGSKEHNLVVYFSHSGNTRELATRVHAQAGGDQLVITTVDPYPSEYDAVVAQAKRELKSGYLPERGMGIENIDAYGVIFIGYPNRCGTLPRPVAAFLQQCEYSSKTIAPFSTLEGSGFGRSALEISKLCNRHISGMAWQSEDRMLATHKVKYLRGWIPYAGLSAFQGVANGQTCIRYQRS